MPNIKINHNNKELKYEKGVTLSKISLDVKNEYENDIIVGSIDNKLMSFDTEITKDVKVRFYDVTTKTGNLAYQRGLEFLFFKAVKEELSCDVRIKHTLDKGIYCEILSNDLLNEVNIEKIKIRMRKLVEQSIDITKIMVSRIDAIEYFERINQKDKANSLRYISNSSISLYKMDDTLDYFYGVLPHNTSVLKKFDVKYIKDNKVILLFPYLYDLKSELKFNKNDKLLDVIDENDNLLENLNIYTSAEFNNTISNGSYGDLVRLSETVQNNKLFEITEKIAKEKNIKIILITGPSSSGKTTTSRKLTLYLKTKGLDPIPISIDDFFIDLDKRILDEDGNPEMESIEVIDTNLFNKKISELLDEKEVYLPRYDFVKGKQIVSDKVTKMNKNSVLIIEGIHAFNEKLTEIIPDKNKFKLFVYPLTPLNIDNHNMFKSTDDRLLRRIIRDNKTRGVSASKTLKYWKNVRTAEEKMVLPYINDADYIFNTYLLYELGVLKTYAEPLLFSVEEDDEDYEEAIRLINLFRLILGVPSEDVPNDSILREFIGGSCFEK